MLAALQVKPSLVDEIRDAQMDDAYLKKIKEKVEIGVNIQFAIRKDGMLVNGRRLYIPDVGELKRHIMNEAHTALYAMHPRSTKMYRVLKPFYWWPIIKKDMAEYATKCLTCQ